MIVVDFCEGDMSRALEDGNHETGLYHLIWTTDGIVKNLIEKEESVEKILSAYRQKRDIVITKSEAARTIINSTKAEIEDNNFYLCLWINEEGVEKSLYFLTLEDDTAKRFVKGWSKYVGAR